MPTTWNFYILHGIAADVGETFWKVGTSDGKFVLKSRKKYGSVVDPSIASTVTAPRNRVYRKPKPSLNRLRQKVSYVAPQLGSKSKLSTILWTPIVEGVPVTWKEIDQLIAAFADDVGKLIFDRGQPDPKVHYRGNIEIICGNEDIYEFIGSVAQGSISSTGREVSAERRMELTALWRRLRPHEDRLKRLHAERSSQAKLTTGHPLIIMAKPAANRPQGISAAVLAA